ncbi:hypothetical protein AYL99_11756 [Fonsecaea erecta]|uniref:Uncharacterized protein n=1 Tax=Fonsecaea erecta TaxID=1367422 RepID=A0A178Z3H3_9EURO|nr:hypothetical protein AYL99_11756 [Fonsecaea erecta]OAP53996.1 hypothetical protein AYL99_11756 [Fonsecaea erecta]
MGSAFSYTAAAFGDKGREKVMRRKKPLDTCDDLIDQPSRDLLITADKTKQSKILGINSGRDPADPLPEFRRLDDCTRYTKVGNQIWERKGDEFSAEQLEIRMDFHCTLISKHQDFLMASQVPMASPEVRGLATKLTCRRECSSTLFIPSSHSYAYNSQSLEFMTAFILHAYRMLCSLETAVPRLDEKWAKWIGDRLTHERCVELSLSASAELVNSPGKLAREHYTRVLYKCSTVGHIYYYLALLAWAQVSQANDSNASFDARVSQFFYYTKALLVATPFFAGRVRAAVRCQPDCHPGLVDPNRQGQLPDQQGSLLPPSM